MVAGLAMIMGSAATASAATAESGAATAASNLLVKYDFNDGTGTTALDSSGNGYDGTLEAGASFTSSGKNFGGLSLNGDGGYLEIPNAPLQGLSNLTLSENIDLNSVSGHVWLATLGYSSTRYLGIDIEGSQLIAYYVQNGNTYQVTGAAPNTGSWANVTLALSSTDETMSLYVNGALQNTTTGLTGNFSSMYDATQTVGGWISQNVWSNPPLNATVDDFRLYNTALPADEISALAAEGPVQPLTAPPVTVSTAPGVAPSLPATVGAPNTDGTSQALPVTWDSVSPAQYASTGEFTVTGETNSTPSLAATATVVVLPKPALQATDTTPSTIRLGWTPEPGATSYSLYRSPTSGSGYSLIYSGDALSYTDTGLVTGTTYYYVVRYTTSLATSLDSNEVRATTVAIPVRPPTGISVTGSYVNAIKLAWSNIPGARSVDIYRSTRAHGPYKLVTNTTGTAYDNTGLRRGTAYYYELSSVDAAGQGARSAPLKATTDPGTSTVFTNKSTFDDVDGNPINAGSGDILKVGHTYYLYGGASTGPFDVNVYSSTDLVHWKYVNQIITTNKTLGTDGKPAADLQASTGNHFERIKVIYDAATKKYVFWAHYEDADYTLAEVGTAFSTSPTGDFTWDHAFSPAGMQSRDETVFVDNDGTGYLISASGVAGGGANSHLTLFQMTPDDLSISKQMYNIYGGANDSGLYAGREAPAMVYYQGYYYLVTSEASGWYPSPAMYSVAKATSLADTTAASWTGNTNIDAAGGWDGGGEAYYLGNRNDFGGQSVYILPVTGTKGTSFLYMNDTLDPTNSSADDGPMWLPLQLSDGTATLNYSRQVNINARTGEISNIYPGSLISQGKPATASLPSATTDSDGNVNPAGWGPSYANDGDYNTEWIASQVTYPYWWQVDLGQEYDVGDVQLSWWMIGGSEATAEFTISVSDDGINWTTAYSTANDNQYGFNDIALPNVEARYLRVTVNSDPAQNTGRTWYTPQIYEARVYGTAARS